MFAARQNARLLVESVDTVTDLSIVGY